MLITRKIATGAATAALASASLLGMGISSATHAGAAPARHHHHHVHCRLHGGRNYPPGKCFIEFNKSKYKPGHTVKFTGMTFKPGATVNEQLTCRHVSKGEGSTTAGSNGAVHDSFSLSSKARKHCTLTLTGGGSKVRGSFKVKKHHH
jgi:hypothetical protein